MIKIISYIGVNDLPFNAGEADAIAKFGNPQLKRKNQEGESEFHYPDLILRFDSVSAKFRECTALPKCDAVVNHTPIKWDRTFLSWVLEQDGDLKEVLGFVLSLKLGIALSGFHDGNESERAVHAFRRGDWNGFSSRMRPFAVT